MFKYLFIVLVKKDIQWFIARQMIIYVEIKTISICGLT